MKIFTPLAYYCVRIWGRLKGLPGNIFRWNGVTPGRFTILWLIVTLVLSQRALMGAKFDVVKWFSRNVLSKEFGWDEYFTGSSSWKPGCTVGWAHNVLMQSSAVPVDVIMAMANFYRLSVCLSVCLFVWSAFGWLVCFARDHTPLQGLKTVEPLSWKLKHKWLPFDHMRSVQRKRFRQELSRTSSLVSECLVCCGKNEIFALKDMSGFRSNPRNVLLSYRWVDLYDW